MQVCHSDFDKSKKQNFQLAQNLREVQQKLQIALKDKLDALEENLLIVKSRKESETRVLELLTEMRDLKESLNEKNERLKKANEEIISLRLNLM